MHVGKNLLLNGAVIIYEDFLGDHMVSGGNQGEGGGRLLYQEGELREN